jgi:NADH-quinone oxidoreductase subunit M
MGASLLAASATPADDQILTVLVLLPAVGALIMALLPARRAELHRPVALLFTMMAGALALYLLAVSTTGDSAGFEFVVQHTWVEDLGISWHLGMDGISLFLVVLTGVLFPIAFLGSDPHHDAKPYYAWLLLLQAGCFGVFLSLDLFLFFVFFEIVLVPMYFLIGGWGYGERIYAALKFFLFTMAGSALMLVGIVALALLHRDGLPDQAEARLEVMQEQVLAGELEVTPAVEAEAEALLDQMENPQLTFDLREIAESGTVVDDSASASPGDWSAARWIFLAFALAFAVKVPLPPLHTWLPDAHTQAPTAGSVILAGVLLKLGTYGLLRLGLYLLPGAATFFAPTLVTLGVIGIIYGAVVATMQRDLKRLVAYSSVAHLGFIVLGTFAITTQGLQGSLLQNINHGISTGALFLLVGMIYERRKTREISALNGLQKVAPVFAAVFTVVMLSSIGLPGLNGFVGEFLILMGSFETLRWWAVVAAAGVILAALYLLWAYQRVFHGEPDEDNRGFLEMSWREGLVMAPLLFLIVFLGVYPKPVLDRMEPAVDCLVQHVNDANGDETDPRDDAHWECPTGSADAELEMADTELDGSVPDEPEEVDETEEEVAGSR